MTHQQDSIAEPLAKRVGGGRQIVDIRGESCASEVPLAIAKPREIEPQRGDAFIGQSAGYANGRHALFRAGEAVREERVGLGLARGQLEAAHVQSWELDPFAGGDYLIWGPGEISQYANEMWRSHGRIHFCGEHTAHLNRGMEGAMESGERVAFEILERA